MIQSRQALNAAERDVLEARFALLVAGRLSERVQNDRHDINERLRFAREQALARTRAARPASVRAEAPSTATAVEVDARGSARLGGGPGDGGLWFKLASLLPILALVLGFMLIQKWNIQAQISAAADVDTELLSDDLPPDAYRDPGFAEFLKSAPSPAQ